MGWVNYIIIPKLKLVIETSRYTEELDESVENAMDEILEFIEKQPVDISMDLFHKKYNDLTLGDLEILLRAFRLVYLVSGEDFDKILLYWLRRKNINYEIVSEYNFNKEKYKKEGYLILEEDEE